MFNAIAGFAATAPLVMVSAAFVLSQPVVVSHWRCGTWLVALFCMAPIAFGPLVVAGAGAGAVGLALLRRFDGCVVLFRGVTLLALAFGAVLVAGGLARSWAPTADEWIDTLPIAGELSPVAPFDCDVSSTAVTCAPRKETFVVAGHTLRRRCHATGRCELRIATEGDGATDDHGWASSDGAATGTVRIGDDAGLLLVGREAAFDLRDGGRLIDVDATRVASAVSPPRAWTWIGLAGLYLGLLAIAAALRRMRERRFLAVARSGRVASGVIAFDDAEHPRRAHVLRATPDGPVLALPTGLTPPPSYRDPGHGPPWRTFPGTRAEALDRNRTAEVTSWLVALASAALATAPLLAALRAGLLF